MKQKSSSKPPPNRQQPQNMHPSVAAYSFEYLHLVHLRMGFTRRVLPQTRSKSLWYKNALSPCVPDLSELLNRPAGLMRDHPVALDIHSPYTNSNETLRNEAWEAINIDAGMIAVPDTFVKEKNLIPSQRFVWDQSKSVYLLNGHHTLHCVRAIYISLMEFWQGKKQSRRWEHVIHCVDQLRQEALCNADDTPRYSTSDDNPVSGLGQTRMCRNWEKLEAWARTYNACYRYINQTASYEDFPQIERFIWFPLY